MKRNKSIFMLVIMLMSIVTQFMTSIGTIKTFADSIGENIINKPSASQTLGTDKNGNLTILTDVKMMVENKNENTIEEITESRPIKVGEIFEIHYKFRIPDQLSLEVEAGDYFEFNLPNSEDIQLTSNQNGRLIDPDDNTDYGTYEATKDGHVVMTFNENVKTHKDVDGNLAFMVSFEEKTIHVPGGYEIDIPYVKKDDSTFIYIAGSTESYITKEYIEANGFVYRWKILINPRYQQMTQLDLTETARELSGGDAVAESINIEKMVKADVNLSGDITEKEEVPLKNKTFDKNGKIDLGFDSINEPYVMYVNTPFPYGIKNAVRNDVLLSAIVNGTHDMENATATSSGNSQIAISKKVLSYDKETQIVEWETTFNPNSYAIKEADAHFRDEITNGTLTEDPMQVNPNLPHNVDVANDRESFDFYFKTDVNQPVSIKYKTKVKDPKLGQIKNKVITGEQVVEVPQGVEDNGNGEDGDGESSITKKTPRPAPDGANWELNINPERQQVDSWWVTDQLDSGTIIKNTLVVTNTTKNQRLTQGKDYELEWIFSPENSNEAIGFTIKYNQSTNEQFKIEYRTITERNTTQRNHAYYHYVVKGTEKEDDDAQRYDPPTVGDVSLSKSGKYIPESREIEWTVLVNERANAPISKDNLLRDPIDDDQFYVDGSARVEYRDGTVWNKYTPATIDFNSNKNELEISNLKTSSNAHRVIFRTKLVNDIDILNRTIENKAYYSDFYTKEVEAKASLTIDNSNNYLAKKTGSQNTINSDVVDWKVVVNPYGYKLNNLVILDDSWENQIVIRESIQLKDPMTNRILMEDIDYDLDYTERYFKITMKNQVDRKLDLTYQGQLKFPYGTPLGSQQTAKNSIKITADRVIKTDKPIDVTIPVKVSDSSGIIQGKVRGLRVKKVSVDNPNEVLSGAEFTLYRGKNIDKNKIVQHATTDNQGYAYFDKLTQGDYLLVETKAPNGYSISSEMESGRVITIKDNDSESVEIVVENPKEGQEIERIDFPVEKRWQGVPPNIETPDVKVTLYSNGNKKETVTLTKNNGYQHVFENLPKQENGKDIDYTVEEENLPNYDSTVSGGVITNTYNNKEKTSLSGEKIWVGDSSHQENRPDRIEIRLLQDGKEYQKKMVYKSDNWKYEFSDLPKVDNSTGKEYKYTVEEVSVPKGYETSISGNNIINTYEEVDYIEFIGEKIWEDNGDRAGKRPSKVEVSLYQDGKEYRKQEVSSNNNWKYRFTELPKYHEGTTQPYEYEVKEVNVPEGYESIVQGNNIINRYTQTEQVSVSGKKVWNDSNNKANKRPESVTIKLLQDRKEYATTEATEKNDWRYSFTDLPKYDENGLLYRYTVEEVDVPEGYESDVNGTTITNTLLEKPVEMISIKGEKIWEDYNNVSNTRPENITVFLYRDDNYLRPYDEKKIEGGNSNRWSYEFTNLPKHDENGREYDYWVEEAKVDHYELTKLNEFDLLNKLNLQGKTKVTGEKIWDDENNEDKIRPDSVTVRLFANGQEVDSTSVSAKTQWKYSFDNLDKYDNQSVEIKYTVKEDKVAGYETKYDSKDNHTIITNKHSVADIFDIKGEKIWVGDEDNTHFRPYSIIIELYRNDSHYDSKTLYASDFEGNRWQYEFKDLEKADENGNLYEYTVQELLVPLNYDSEVDGYNIINTFKNKELIDIPVEKIWHDGNGKIKGRPSWLTVHLEHYENGRWYQSGDRVRLSEDNNWRYVYKNCYKYFDDGSLIEYRVVEEDSNGVLAPYESVTNGVQLINTLKPIKKAIRVTKNWRGEPKDEDGKVDTSFRPDFITINLYRNDVLIESRQLTEQNQNSQYSWVYEFQDLDVFDPVTFEKYVYTVEEEQVPNYESEISMSSNGSTATIFNTFKPTEKIDISGQKYWDDKNNGFDKPRPNEITIDLYQDNKLVDSTTTDASKDWKYEFKELLKFNPDTKEEYNYTVKENNVPNGYISNIEGYDIYNVYQNNKLTKVSGEKHWIDYQNKFNTRPESIEVKLYQNNKLHQTQVVKSNGTDRWQYSFENLKVYDNNGKEYIYHVEEDKVPNGYDSKIEGNTITNTYVNTEKTEISGNKIWNDYQNGFNTRPESITVELYNGNTKVKSQEVKPDQNGDWQYKFTNLPKYDDKGELISYTVKEVPVDSYETTIKGKDIINTYVNTEKTEISVEKKWQDEDNKLNLRPTSIKVNLLRNESVIKTEELSDANQWQHTFSDLDKYDNNGDEYRYTVVEEGIPHYLTTYETNNQKVTISNELNSNDTLTNLSGLKIWDDYNNKFGTRPDKIKVTLLQDGEVMLDKTGKPVSQEVSETTKWAYAFEDLPKINPVTKDDYLYTVKEDEVGNGYDKPIYEGSNITNRYRNKEVVTINGSKVWDDYNNKFLTRPESITVNLLQDNVVIKSIEASKEQDYAFTFDNLPKYDENGVLYEYKVIEDVPSPYTVEEKVEIIKEDNTMNVLLTNTYKNNETVELNGEKTWDDYENKFNTRPSTITVQLYNHDQYLESQQVVPDSNGDWTYSFKELPKYDNDGNLNKYSVKEVILNNEHGYTSEVVGNDLINHYVNKEIVNFKGQKIWNDYDNKFNTRPESVTIYLYKDKSRIETTTTDASKDWKYEFNNNYPVYDENGNEINYTIKEKSVKPYTTEVSESTSIKQGNETIVETNITNQYVNKETKTLSGDKTWDDFDNQFGNRPDSIVITLEAHNKATNETTYQTTNASKESNWKYEFINLPVYDELGEEIEYTISEETIDGYEQTQGAPKFINRAKELDAKTSISGKKIWKDENNKLKTRPESITVTLYQNDLPMLNDKNEVVTQVVDITTMWSYHFENLPKYDSEGKLYEYSVKESFSTGLDKYQTEVIGNDIVNTYINNEKIEVSGEKRWNDLDNKLGKRPSSIKVVLYQSGSEKPYQEKEVFPNESGDWFYVFSDLPKYDDELNLYTYRVEEKNVPHYETASEGKYDLVNTYINDEVTEVSGEKLWYDIDNKLNTRPESITVELYQNNGEKPFKTQEVKPNENGEWKYEFKELPKYDENYDLYEYTIKETPVAHYESQIYSDSPTTIYNRYINNETTNVKVIKKWDDEGNLLQTRPKSIRVNLYRNNGRIPYKTQTILPNENGMWSHEFKDLPKYDNNLELYEYTVKEMKVSDYTATVENDQTNNVSIITNTYTNPEKIEINGYKSWLDHDNKLGTRPASIFVDLFRSDSNEVYQTQEVVPNEDGYWFYSFKDLPKYDDKLQLYTYTVKEQPVEHYESQVSYPNIVNSYKNDETISLKGEKIWNDKENKLKTRPENITVELYQGNRLYDRKDVVADEDGKWLYEFSDLPKYNADLDEYIYTVREPKVPGYNTEITGTNITNHYQNNETVTVPVKKVWDDQSNKLNTRPSMIKIELYQNGGEKPYKVETLLPNGTDVWSHEFVNLPKYDEELNEYMYTVKEQPVAGYESSITGTTITNKYINNQFTSIKGEKKWEDQDNKLGTRPEKIYVDLYQGDSKKSMATEVVEADENGHWEYEFVNLPKYDDGLNEYSYRVEEKKVPHYDTEIVGTTIVNRYRNDDKVDLNGKKVWKDLDNKLNTRPGKIKVDLYQNESSIPMKSKTVKADENGEWNYSFKDLPKYDDQLNEYRYSVKEQPVKGYESSVEGTTITNTYQNNEKTSISGKKVWKDENNILNSRPESIIVELHQNGAKEVMDEKEITADSEGNWSYSFTDLPKYDEQLEEYTYSVTEKKVPQYETSINGTTITNTYLNNETVTIEGQKTWKDQDNKLNTRPKSIKVDLYQNEGNKPYKTQTVKADDKGNWIYEFVDLPKYDEHLVEYKYTVKEQPVKNYDSEVVGLNIENTYQNTDVTSLKGEKTWDDLDNKLGKRPTEIFVELYQTTKETPEITADQKPFEVQKVKPNLLGNWEYEFTNLPKYDDKLDEYNYLVKEQFVKDYDSEITGSNIKNTYQNKETVTIDGQKIWKNDFDNKLNSRPESIVVNLYQNNSDEIYESQTVKPDENGNWNYSFKELPKYDNELNEFTYTVKEVPVSHYESKVKGTTITNTYQNTDVTTIKGQKQWNDEEDKLKKRPKSITVDLYQNDSKKPIDSQEVTAGADNQWRYEFKDLPKYDKELNEFVYTVKEHEVDDYKTTIEGTTIINTYKNVETTQVTGEKKWEDFDNKLNSRPSVITVDLYQNDVKEPYRSQVVVPDKNGKWNYTFKELPKYDENLNEYTYTVKEQSVPHYTSTVTGTDITNTYLNNDKINVEGKKVWKDLDNKLNLRPESIIVELYQNNGDEPFKIQEVSAGKNNDWNYSFKDLPKYDEELNEYNYTVKEKEVPHYETSIKGTTITNTYRNDDVTQVKGEKIWRDLDDKLNLRPETITVELYQNNDKKPFKTQEVSAGADNKWQYEFKNLPKYDENLNEYTYTVKEQTVPHYDSQIEGSNIINTYRNDDLIDLNGKKVWKDFDDKLKVRPQSITVELYQNGGSEPYKTQKVTAGSDKQWHYSFKDLPKYDNELNEYIYTVKEVEVSHYDTTIEGTTITNHYRNDDVTKVVGEKLWKDSDNKLSSRPETITIELYQNNDKQPLKTQEVKADENNHWRYSFNDLPKYDDQLNEFVYTVREKEVPHYDTSIDGTTITNTYRNDEVTEITGKKLWEDNNNKKNTRPDSIVVEVYQNDGKKAYQSQVVKPNKDGAWLFKFTDLPKYDKNLNEYRYSIKEIPVKGYQTRINGTTIVNTLVDEKIPTKPVDPKKPGDGYLPKTGENNESLLASLLGISLLSVTSVGLYFRRRKY